MEKFPINQTAEQTSKDQLLDQIIEQLSDPHTLFEIHSASAQILQSVHDIAAHTGFDIEKTGGTIIPYIIKQENKARVAEAQQLITKITNLIAAEVKESSTKERIAQIASIEYCGSSIWNIFGISFDRNNLAISKASLQSVITQVDPAEMYLKTESACKQIISRDKAGESEAFTFYCDSVINQFLNTLHLYKQDCLSFAEIQSQKLKPLHVDRYQMYTLIDSLENIQEVIYKLSEKLVEQSNSNEDRQIFTISLLNTLNTYVYILQRLTNIDYRFAPILKNYKEKSFAIRLQAKQMYEVLVSTYGDEKRTKKKIEMLFFTNIDKFIQHFNIYGTLTDSTKKDGSFTNQGLIIRNDSDFITSLCYPLDAINTNDAIHAHNISKVSSFNGNMNVTGEEIQQLIQFFLPQTVTEPEPAQEIIEQEIEPEIHKNAEYYYTKIRDAISNTDFGDTCIIFEKPFVDILHSNKVRSNFKVLQSLESTLFELQILIIKCPRNHCLKEYLLEHAHTLGAEKRDHLNNKKVAVRKGSVVIDLKAGYRILFDVNEETRTVQFYYLGNYHRG
jgi:hypothetical protein